MRFARRRGGRLPVSRRFRTLNLLPRIVIGLLLIAGSASHVYAEVRFPLPSAMKDFSKPGIRLDAPVHLTADTLSYDEETGVAVAEGNVELVFGTRTMRADRIRYDSTTGEADLTGKVRYKDADEEFAFDRITINLDSETGVLYNGTIRISSSNYLIASGKIEKTGKSSFLIEKGMLTTCPCDPEPDWKFEVRRARVTLDKYAVGRDITFRIRGSSRPVASVGGVSRQDDAAERTPAPELLLQPVQGIHAAGAVLPGDQPLERRHRDARRDEPPRIPPGGRVPVRPESGIGGSDPRDDVPGPGRRSDPGPLLRGKRFPFRPLHRERDSGSAYRSPVLPRPGRQ